jgi:hypothetical protein
MEIQRLSSAHVEHSTARRDVDILLNHMEKQFNQKCAAIERVGPATVLYRMPTDCCKPGSRTRSLPLPTAL